MFLEFHTEAGYDVLTIYDGPSSLSTEIATVSGQYSSGPVYFSSGTSMWFEFSSDSSNTRRGFHANYTAIHGAGRWTDLIKKVSCHGERIARKHFESRSVPEGNTLRRPSSLWTPPEDTIMKSHEIKKNWSSFWRLANWRKGLLPLLCRHHIDAVPYTEIAVLLLIGLDKRLTPGFLNPSKSFL